MPTQDTQPTKEKIIEVLKKRGPSLPVHIANETGLSMLFASAFLGELLSSKKIKIGHMKVGSSPIYLIPGQEPRLEPFSQYLKSKEKDAFDLIKEKKFLQDSELDPAIRVAIRQIKDFALVFQVDSKIIWRYFTVPESEYKTPIKKPSIEPTPKIKENSIEPSQDNNSKNNKQEEAKELNIFDKKQNQEEPEFIPNVLRYIERSEIKLIEETETKKREFLGIGRIDSPLGEMEILLIGKDKKKITEKDLENILEKAKESNKIVLLFLNGEIDKKAKEYYRKIKNMIYLKNIE